MAAATSGGCHDLRKYQNDPQVQAAFSKIISGKLGYQAVIEKRVEPPKCKKCSVLLEGNEKFCPECGAKVEKLTEAQQAKENEEAQNRTCAEIRG